jgi:hypothetical protein
MPQRILVLTALLGGIGCTTPELPRARARDLPALAAVRPVAVLFSVPDCRYCRIAERGFVGAARTLQGRVDFRKVIVTGKNLASLRSRYALLPSMPQGRLILAGERSSPLPLTREGPLVQQAIEALLAR